MTGKQKSKELEGKGFKTSKKVLNIDTGNIEFQPESKIQTMLSETKQGEMLYQPVPEADAVKPVKVYDAKEGVTRFVNQSDILTTTYELDGKTKDRSDRDWETGWYNISPCLVSDNIV